MEIYGIPHTKTEDPVEIVNKFGKALGCEIVRSMIDVRHRLRSFKSNVPQRLIGRFVRRSDTEELLRKRRIKMEFSTSPMNLNVVSPIHDPHK